MNTVLLLGILLLIALFTTRITRLGHLPNVTAFLLIGVFVAIVCLLIDKTGYVDIEGNTLSESLTKMNGFVSNIALGFIALSIGQEFKLSKISKLGKKIVSITFFQTLTTLILVDIVLLIACKFLNVNSGVAICLGAIATATAPAATMMVIHQYNAKGSLVDTLIPIVAFDDAIGLIVFSISIAISKVLVSGGPINFISLALIPLLEIVVSLGIGFILGLLMHIVIKYFKSRNNHMIVIIAFTLLGVGICLSLNTLKINGESLEFSSLLTCMMTGAAYVNLSKDNEEQILSRDFELIDRWEQFLLTLFFTLSGTHLVISGHTLLTQNSNSGIELIICIFILYFVFRSLGKYFGAFLGCKVNKCDNNTTKYLGLTLLPQAGVAIGMANQISSMEAFNVSNMGSLIVTVVLLATLVYEIFGPVITKWALTKSHNITQ